MFIIFAGTAVCAVCPRVIVLGGPHADLPDDTPDAGPMAALATAFAHLDDDALFLTACDLPQLTPEVVRLVVTHDDHGTAIVARSPDGRAQPLVARYPRSCVPSLTPAPTPNDPGGASLSGLLDRIPVTYVTPPGPGDWALNINRTTDLPGEAGLR